MKKLIPINTTADECAFAIKTNYFKTALSDMTRGGRTFSLDRSAGGLARTITARYYKTGAANILEHWEDGYSDTGIIEIEDSAGDEEGIH